jgi:hypothetical protein
MTRSYSASRRDTANLRLRVQGIASPSGASPDDTVRRMLAMQAQDYTGALWAVGLRTPGSTEASIESALADGRVVRSWPMRGTLHLVPPEDLGWMLSVTAPRTLRSTDSRRVQLGLTHADLAVARDTAVDRLSGGRVLARDELLGAFDAAGASTASQRGYHLLLHLGITRVIVFGPVRVTPGGGRQHTFALLDEWVTAPRRLEPDEALGQLAARYFAGHGPATVRDLAWWASLTLTQARRGTELAREGLDALDVDGTEYLLPRDLPAGDGASGPAPAAASGVHALPGFDEYLLGYRDRGAALAPEHASLVVPGKNGLFLPTIVVDGEVVGTWRRTLSPKGVIVEASPFGSMSARTARALESTLDRYARFVGRERQSPA